LDELFEGRVIVVYSVQGAHTANSSTGEYSVLANPAILYEEGEPVGWLRGLAVAGSFYNELRDNVVGLSGVVEKPYPGIWVPWIRLTGIQVAQGRS